MKAKTAKKENPLGDWKRGAKLPPDISPLITIDEAINERFFWIVEFTIPGMNEVRRFISKRTADGIYAVTYVGVRGSDGIVGHKADIRSKTFTSEQDFIKQMRLVHLIIHLQGGVTRILNLDGMTLPQALETIERNDWGTVASPEEFLKYAGNNNGELVH